MAGLRALLKGPGLPDDCRHTYVRHFAFALLDATAAGILVNAPVMAIKGMESPDWQLALQLSISSIGMFLLVYLGGRMAVGRKKPFVLVPGLAYAASSAMMAMTGSALIFLVLLGVGTLLETITRPAVTAVIRLNYPATHRGAATGEIRKWYSLTFLAASLISAFALDRVADAPAAMIKGQMVLAALLSVTGYLVFASIRVKEDAAALAKEKPHPLSHFKEAGRIFVRDRRFRRYLAIGFLYAFGGLMYVSFIPVFLTRELGYGYVGTSVLTTILPSLVAFLSTGAIGRWVDRVHVWKAWAWIRLGWGLDGILLSVTQLAASVFPPAAQILPVMGRVSRGSVMGGSWILWWQVAVNHFAPPGGDTTRYMGVLLFVNGLCRLLAPMAGAALLGASNVSFVLFFGGTLVLLSAAVSAFEYRREMSENRPATMATFEESFENRGQ